MCQSSLRATRTQYNLLTYQNYVFLMWCEYRVDTDGADDKLSDKSAESGDEVEHPKYTVRLVPLNICQLILKSFFCCKATDNSSSLSCVHYIAAFYHVTLCISAVFAVARCLSVRLSLTLVDCIQMAEDIVKLFIRPGSPIILVFWPRAPIPNSEGTPLAGAQNTWVRKFAIYDWNCHLSRYQYEIGPWLLWNINRKSLAVDRSVSVPLTLSDP